MDQNITRGVTIGQGEGGANFDERNNVRERERMVRKNLSEDGKFLAEKQIPSFEETRYSPDLAL